MGGSSGVTGSGNNWAHLGGINSNTNYGGSLLTSSGNLSLFPEIRPANGGSGQWSATEPSPNQFEAQLANPASFDPAEMNYFIDNTFNLPVPLKPGPTGYYRAVDKSYAGSSPNANTVNDEDLEFRVAGAGGSFVPVPPFSEAGSDSLGPP